MQVEGFGLALVEANENLVRMVAIRDDVGDASALKGRQVTGFVRFGVDGEHVPIFIAVGVLQVEYRLVVLCPEIHADAGSAALSDGAIVVFSDRLDPDVEDTFVGSEVSEAQSVGTQTGAGAFWVAEEHGAGDQRTSGRHEGS